MSPSEPRPGRDLAVVVLVAALVFWGVDLAVRPVAPPQHLPEVQEGMADLQASDPHVLVLGSSYGRAFWAVKDELARLTGGERHLAAVAVEHGKLSVYEWILQNRILPVLDATDASGRRQRTRLQHFVLVTEWWDSLPYGEGDPGANLPALGWTLDHFLADVARVGINQFNRNYLQKRWRRLFHDFALVQDRGFHTLIDSVRAALVGRIRPELRPEAVAARLEASTQLLEESIRGLGHAEQMRAWRSILSTMRARGVEVTIVLYPTMPAKRTRAGVATLERFHALAAGVAAEHGARLVDLSQWAPILDTDFGADCDHLTAEGDAKFARLGLAGPLAFLRNGASSERVR